MPLFSRPGHQSEKIFIPFHTRAKASKRERGQRFYYYEKFPSCRNIKLPHSKTKAM